MSEEDNNNKHGFNVNSEIIDGIYDKLENIIKNLNNSFKEDLVPEIEKKARQNPFLSILTAFLAGMITCFIMYPRGPKHGG